MGCFSDREKGPPERTARWEFINLEDFKSTGLGAVLAYAWLWFMAMVSIAVYSVDTFTAVNLLAFNNWSSSIQPTLPFKYSKWIFSICILVSWALAIFEWVRAVRVIRRGGVAESYMDPLAVTLQSMRSRGWKRFLVFKALTNSKKRIDYVALFVYFAFKGAVRVVCAEGPRQVVNAITLYSVTQAQLIGHGSAGQSSIEQFFSNIKALADQDDRQVIILASMLFTLVIWVFSALSLIAAVTCYLLFLWHYIPQRDARLSIYCRRKIDKRLEKIVEHKVKAAIDEENRKREKAEQKAELKRQKTGELPPPAPPKIARQPTLPQLGDNDIKRESEFGGNTLARQNTSSTVSTLPLYSSQTPAMSGIQRQPTLPDISEADPRPRPPYRTGTQGSDWSQNSFAPDAPLLANAAGVGARMQSPAPTYYSRQDSDAGFRRPPVPRKAMTNGLQGTQNPVGSMSRMDSQSSFGNPPRSYTPYSATNATQYDPNPRFQSGRGLPTRSNTMAEFDEPSVAGGYAQAPYDRNGSSTPYAPYHPRTDSQSTRLDDPNSPPTASVNAVSMTNEQATYSNIHGRQASFSRPFGRTTPASGLSSQTGRRQPSESLHSQQSSFSRPIPPRKPTPPRLGSQSSISSPTNISLQRGASKPEVDSYEMTTQPSYKSYTPAPSSNGLGGAGAYVAFNPNASLHTGAALTTSPPPIAPITSHNNSTVAVTGNPGQDGSYFGRVEQRSPQHSAFGSGLMPPPSSEHHRLTTGYADILDDYGGYTPMEGGHESL